MEQTYKPYIEDVDIPFVNDEQVIGKWLVLGECGDGENYPTLLIGDGNRHLYFLPNGEFYWCFGWTKGKLIFGDGESSFANDYRIEQRGDDLNIKENLITPIMNGYTNQEVVHTG